MSIQKNMTFVALVDMALYQKTHSGALYERDNFDANADDNSSSSSSSGSRTSRVNDDVNGSAGNPGNQQQDQQVDTGRGFFYYEIALETINRSLNKTSQVRKEAHRRNDGASSSILTHQHAQFLHE